jgi:tetratricopeptide (TPR) repeat protein
LNKLRVAVAALAALSGATGASAAWMEARSAHFIVIGNGKPGDIQDMAIELEQFDSVIRHFHGMQDTDASQANPLTVYVVSNTSDVANYCRGCPPDVAGFYEGRASGSVAWTPKRSGAGYNTDLKPQQVLFHEYGHHFLLGNWSMAAPPWFTEGYAEFVATVVKSKDGYLVGSPPLYRGWSLTRGVPLSAEELFDPARRSKLTPDQRESLYARGWLLTHYLLLDAERIKQLHKYLALLNSGTPSIDAAKQVFGDLGALDKALNTYLAARYMRAMTIKFADIPTPKIELRALTDGQAAMIPLRMQSRAGVNGETAKPLYAKAVAAAVPYAGDAVVQGWLSEMALDAGETDAAIADADKALAIDLRQTQALIYLARARMAAAVKTKGDAAVWSKVRAPIVQANRGNPNNAEPLMLYYQTYLQQGQTPPKIAVEGLLRAVELVPQDDNLRFMAVEQMINDRNGDMAIRLLRPIAYDPHRPADSPAAKLLSLLTGKNLDAAAAFIKDEPDSNKGKSVDRSGGGKPSDKPTDKPGDGKSMDKPKG